MEFECDCGSGEFEQDTLKSTEEMYCFKCDWCGKEYTTTFIIES